MSSKDLTQNGEASDGSEVTMSFQSAYSACNFIVTWDGEDVRELFRAIAFARQTGDRFIQDKLIEYILNIPYRNPRPADIPAFIGKPVWAVDKHGRALIGMPGAETIIDAAALQTQVRKALPQSQATDDETPTASSIPRDA